MVFPCLAVLASPELRLEPWISCKPPQPSLVYYQALVFSSQISFAFWIFCRCGKRARLSFILWKNHNGKVCLPNAEDSSKIYSCIDLSRFEVVFSINTQRSNKEAPVPIPCLWGEKARWRGGGWGGGGEGAFRLLCLLRRWTAPSSNPQMCRSPLGFPGSKSFT